MRLALILFNLIFCLPVYSDENPEIIDVKISSEKSWLRVLAYPDGRLKHLGHHHVISHQNINGNVKLSKDPLNSSIYIELDVNDFVVDDPSLRMIEGGVFDGEVPQKDMLQAIGPTLVVTAITKDQNFKNQLLASSNVERLNIGPISTMKISWDQPHEGNMFEFLYKRRSIGMAA